MNPWLPFLIGLALLVIGGELLVKGSSQLGAAIGISRLVVGLTIVAFGTSSPELAVSVISALQGISDLAVSNVVGSNIFNVLLILGLCATLRPLQISTQIVRLEVPLMVAASVLLLLVGLDGTLSRLDGAILLSALIAYVIFTIVQSRKSEKALKKTESSPSSPSSSLSLHPNPTIPALTGMVAGGLFLLVLGARLLVNGAVSIAQGLGISEAVIGLTIVAAGTSMPEVASSVVATIRKEREIAVGNVVGSNLFNILGVLGACSLISPMGLSVSPSILSFDIPVMLAVAFACMPIFFSGHRISRWEGALFLGYYAAYIFYLTLDVQRHEDIQAVSGIMTAYVLPLTLLTLVIGYVRHFLRSQSPESRKPAGE